MNIEDIKNDNNQIVLPIKEYYNLIEIKEKYNKVSNNKKCVVYAEKRRKCYSDYDFRGTFCGFPSPFDFDNYKNFEFDTTKVETENKVIKRAILSFEETQENLLKLNKNLVKELNKAHCLKREAQKKYNELKKDCNNEFCLSSFFTGVACTIIFIVVISLMFCNRCGG